MGAVAVVPVETGEAGKGGKALVSQSSRGVRLLRPIAAPAEMIEQQNQTRAYVKEVLKEGRDYGKIPGVDKPSLLKPGAEKVVLGFGCSQLATIVEQEIDHERVFPWVKKKAIWGKDPNDPSTRKRIGEEVVSGESVGLYRYVVRVDVVDQDGAIRGSGIGSCSTMESKYIDRPRDSENTVLKMATKRALVAATLSTFGLSDEFTQDVEETRPHAVADDEAAGEGGEGAAPARDPRDTVMKFGFTGVKGKQLGELTDAQLTNAITWAESQGKFKEIVADSRAVLKMRAAEAEGTMKKEAEASASGAAASTSARVQPSERARSDEEMEREAARQRAMDRELEHGLEGGPDDLPF